MEDNKPADNKALNNEAQKQIKDITERAAREAAWRDEMISAEGVKNYLDGFEPESVESFINNYLGQKSMWYEYGGMYARLQENEDLQFENDAFKHLAIIQQKKLFDLQCLWRAEKVKVPGIEICFDFTYWQHDILNCPFIDPVSEEELALYMQYLQQNNVELDEYFLGTGWQDYDELKEAYNTDNEHADFPEWYDFYNGRRGTGSLLLLPDIRGEKEEAYMKVFRAHDREKNREATAAWEKKWAERKPSLSYYNNEHTDWFVSTFESKEIQRLYKSFTWYNRNMDSEMQVEENIRFLLKAEEYVPIEAHYNWIEALELAVQKYRCKKIGESLPGAWEQYMITVETGIAFTNEQDYDDLREQVAGYILAGRKLMGEPENFDF